MELCSFELFNASKWKLMAEDAVRSVCEGGLINWPIPPPLCANPLDAAALSNDLEQQLRVLVTEHRRVRHPPKTTTCSSKSSKTEVHETISVGSGPSKHMGRPPVVLADAGSRGLRDGARDWRFSGKRRVSASHQTRGSRRTHVQGLPDPVRTSQRAKSTHRLSQVSWSGCQSLLWF